MTVAEKKKTLESYISLVDRAEELRAEIADLRARADSLLVNIDGLPRSYADGTKVERILENIERSVKRLINEEAEICLTINSITKAIGMLPDVRERQILSLKYIGQKQGSAFRRYTLWEIANRMGYSEARIKQLHLSALQNITL